MSFTAGIIGLPNSGKTTIFNALTGSQAEASLYPFCTIEPNSANVPCLDQRLNQLVALLAPEQWAAAAITFLDVAGLVRGAAQGEGLGNQFLGHIRTADVLVHVIRCFKNNRVAHVSGALDPLDDIEIINTELILADLDVLERRALKMRKLQRGGDKSLIDAIKLIERAELALNQGQPARNMPLFSEEERGILNSFDLLTSRPVIYLANIDESDIGQGSPLVERIRARAHEDGTELLALCGELEAGLVGLDSEEQTQFRAEYGLTASGLEQLLATVIAQLHLTTFYTITGKEMRSWLIPEKTVAPLAAGKVHSDMERGFIKAEVLSFDDLARATSWNKAKELGYIRVEGKNYQIQDGDVVLFRFNT